jgi:hypothetical protein
MHSNLVIHQGNTLEGPEETQFEFNLDAKSEENVTIVKHIAPLSEDDSGYCQTTTVSLDDLIEFVEKAQDALVEIAMQNEYYENHSNPRSTSRQEV